MDGFVRLIAQKYFVVDRYDVGAGGEAVIPIAGAGCLVGLDGSAMVTAGSMSVELLRGQAVVLPAGMGSVRLTSDAGVSLVRCFAPAS